MATEIAAGVGVGTTGEGSAERKARRAIALIQKARKKNYGSRKGSNGDSRFELKGRSSLPASLPSIVSL